MRKYLFLLVTSTLLLFYSSTLSISAADTFCCTFDGFSNKCLVDAGRTSCTYAPGAGSWEDNYCQKFNSSQSNCNNTCSFCQYAQPTSTTAPNQPTPSSPPLDCHNCELTNGSPACYKVAPNPSGKCDGFESAYDCNLYCFSTNPPAINYSCDYQRGVCLPSPNGQFTSGSDCLINCRSTSGPLVFCNTSKFISPFVLKEITPYINTALGCVYYLAPQFTNDFLKWSVGIGSAVAFLVIIYGSLLWITGGHDPKKIQTGQEMIIAALSGIIMVIISIVLINYLGATLLKLGPLGFKQ